jgi:DNA polymerase-1
VNIHQLLQELHYRDITLIRVGDKLRCKVGGRPLPADLREQVLAHRAELLVALAAVGEGGDSKPSVNEGVPETNNFPQTCTLYPLYPLYSPDPKVGGSQNGHSSALETIPGVAGSSTPDTLTLLSTGLAATPPVVGPEPPPEAAPESPEEVEDIDIEFTYVVDNETTRQVVAQLEKEVLTAWDTETIRLNYDPKKSAEEDEFIPDLYQDRVRLVQVASPSGIWVFDLFRTNPLLLIPALISPGAKLAHNAQFDLAFLHQLTGATPTNAICTMILDQVIRAVQGVKHGLGPVALHHLGLPMEDKEELQGSDWSAPVLKKRQLAYAARDAAILLEIYSKQQKDIAAHDLQRVVDLELRLLPAVVLMWEEGIGFDWDRWCSVYHNCQQEFGEVGEALKVTLPTHLSRERIFHALVQATKNKKPSKKLQKTFDQGDDLPVNWGSGDQCGQLLRAMGVQLPLTKKSKQYRTDKDTLTEHKDDHVIMPLVRGYRGLKSLMSKYGLGWEKYINGVTGKVHAGFRQHGTVTGRFSISDPALHNVPRGGGFRECFTALPGFVFLILDLSQVEVRVVSQVSGDEAMIRIFESGEDIYEAVARIVLNITDRRPTKAERQLAKPIVLGLIYGMQPKGLVEYANHAFGVDMTEQQAVGFIQKFFGSFPQLKDWQIRERARLRRQGRVETRTPLGRRRVITDGDNSWGGGGGQEVLNTPIQSQAADALKLAIVLLHESRDELPEASTALCVHDEILYQCPIDKIEQGKARLAWAMDKGLIDTGLTRVPTGVRVEDIVVSDRWIKV